MLLLACAALNTDVRSHESIDKITRAKVASFKLTCSLSSWILHVWPSEINLGLNCLRGICISTVCAVQSGPYFIPWTGPLVQSVGPVRSVNYTLPHLTLININL